MTTPKTDVKPQTLELATEAFGAFCNDISGMFNVGMKCSRQEVYDETAKGLSQKFKELAAVSSIKSQGILDGTFQVVFDQGGLFTLAGIIVMRPKEKIIEETKRGSAKEAEGMTDTIKEAGNLLVSSWDRIFRQGLQGHDNFTQTNIFIGNPWDSPKEKIGFSGEEEFLFAPYEITIDDYPAFNCGVIFPKTIFILPENPAAADEKSPQEEAKAPEEQDAETKTEVLDEEVSKTSECADGIEAAGPVSESIQKMTQSLTSLPDKTSLISLTMCAKDIMQKEVLWGNAEDSVEQTLTKMQQADAGYMMVGKEGGLPDGIVSTFDIASTLSVYLKPMFAKWRRPIDDATLQIKIKWIMTRPVHTIKPDTLLSALMESMCQSGVRCLPVIDNGRVVGLVTVFDIFKSLLNTDADSSITGKTSQAPSLA